MVSIGPNISADSGFRFGILSQKGIDFDLAELGRRSWGNGRSYPEGLGNHLSIRRVLHRLKQICIPQTPCRSRRNSRSFRLPQHTYSSLLCRTPRAVARTIVEIFSLCIVILERTKPSKIVLLRRVDPDGGKTTIQVFSAGVLTAPFQSSDSYRSSGDPTSSAVRRHPSKLPHQSCPPSCPSP